MIYGKRKGGFYIMKAFELLLDILKGAKRENVVDIMLYIILWASLILEIILIIFIENRELFLFMELLKLLLLIASMVIPSYFFDILIMSAYCAYKNYDASHLRYLLVLPLVIMIVMNFIYIFIFMLCGIPFSFQIKYMVGVLLLIVLSYLNLKIDGKKYAIKLNEECSDNK